ncbi:MAG: hypothetical protein FJ304_25865 [Planctomycetes bacterium]|nr:hypothetical protein [Planctomycetota bacterium]
MAQLGVTVRLLVLVACLVPFCGARQAVAAVAPLVPLAPSGPEAPAPLEEDDERETDGKERLGASARHRPAAREHVGKLPATHVARCAVILYVRTTPLVPVDHFRNGLGTPYRC